MIRNFNTKRMSLILIFPIVTMIIVAMTTQSYAIMQVGGNDTIQITPGQTKPFTWGLISDLNTTKTYEISATGDGAKFISLPKTVVLEPQETVNIDGKVTIPQDFKGGVTLTATLKATGISKNVNASSETDAVAQIKVVPVKTLSIVVDNK